MAGTQEQTQPGQGPPPAVVLVQPQLGQNIGMCARAMLNCGLEEMRLVAPRDGWPNEEATAAASGADHILERARIFESVTAAVADMNRVYATTARPRDMVKPVTTPRQAAGAARAAAVQGERVAVLFGPERSGLDNEAVALADAVVAVPLNPAFTSLNLAQAVLLIGYEWWQAADATPPRELVGTPTAGAPVSKAELENFQARLETALDEAGFFSVPEKRPTVVRNIRNIFARAGLTKGEVDTLHGILSALIKAPKWPRRTRW
jgi:tRNA/rRNA methyltransferase